MAINAGTSYNEIIGLIDKVKTDTKSICSETINSTLQSGIIDAMAESWYAEDAVYFMNSFASIVYAVTSEIAVQANTVIYNIAGAYDYWLRSTSGKDLGESTDMYTQSVGGGDAFTIQAEPAETTTNPVNGAGGYEPLPETGDSSAAANYVETTGGSGNNNAYTYLSSEETQVKLNVSAIKPESDNFEVGIDTEVASSVMGNLETMKADITTALSTMQGELDASAALIDTTGTQKDAVSGFYAAVTAEIGKMFDFLTEGENSLSSSIQATIEKYGTTIVSNIGSSIDAAAEGGDGTSASSGA